MKRLAAIAGGSALLVVVALAIFIATFDVNRYKPEIVKLVHERTGRTLAIDGDLGIALFPKISATTGHVVVSEVGRAEPFARIESARVALALWPLLSRQVVADRIELTGLDVTLVKHRDGSTNFGDLLGKPTGTPARPVAGTSPAGPPSTGQPLAIDVSGVTLKDARVRWHDEAGSTDITVSGLTLTTGRIASSVPAKLSLTGTLQGKQPALHLKLSLDSGYRVDFDGRAVDLPDLAMKLDGIDGHLLKVVANGAGAVNWGKETASVDLKIKIDDANVHAKVNVTGYSSPAIHFDVEADRSNLDRYQSAERAAKPAPAVGGVKSDGATRSGAATSPGAPIDLGALKTLNANGSVRVGALTVAGLHAESVRATVKVAGGRVDVNPLAANLYQGTLAGSVVINAQTNAYVIKQQLTGVAIGPLLRDLAGKDLLEGRGTVALDVTTSGTTVGALKHGLAGNANVNLRDGAIKGINLAEIARKARALRSGGIENMEAVKSEKTDFSEMTASFQIRGGVAHGDDLAMKSPFLRLGGAGAIDIGGSTIDYTVKATVVGTTTGQDGKPLADMRGVTIPVRVTGALDAPKYQVDFRSMLTDAAKDEVRKRIEEALKDKLDERLKGRIGEGIRGLFGK